ncbi:MULTISPECIES: hypothetical protein [Mycobacteriaceae]|uniref:Uncharacterized protein n=1 Tax=Mycolicibacterium neoaurum VKM Ac-1815D TaxID=700508 RepID=V5XJL0_MYCNE|nr:MULTISPECIES: hypothetical protein [Mycobacteriaceae]AHC27824.1 hypothetical protein D174_04230 [Mycolicibacterium neoaurum VKM Ac-1815D]AMO04513.1 hypothetical protein MyAD_04140 [Mycolicibacterium neoaurum]AXK77198.1 hypothetical protein DXK33_20985 [Mycolicibacterium neoaurum]KJQ48536.1 hypothetical protein TS71_20720 [Mycolicibacterium neoaurum]KUM06923.1 hypothetical protein AVZ31_18890 [Mycolicibacterium neoaurum]
MTRIPIHAAYEQNGALDRGCPQCDAGPRQWCIDSRGRIRRVPCVLRTRIPGQLTEVAGADNLAGQLNVVDSEDNAEPLDFGEPRHPPAGGAV